MTPLERAAAAIEDMTGWGADGDPPIDIARAVIAAIREPIADASVYLKADAEAWELGATGTPHEVYLMECGRLRRSIAEKLDALLAEGK